MFFGDLQEADRRGSRQHEEDRIHPFRQGLEIDRVQVHRCRIHQNRRPLQALAFHKLVHPVTGPAAIVGDVEADTGGVLGTEFFDRKSQCTDAGRQRTLVGRDDVGAFIAFGNGAAGCHYHHVFILVEPGIDRHRYDRTVPHQGHHAFVFHQLGRDLTGQFRVPLIVLDDVLDRAAMDAAIGVDAIEKRRRRIGSSREVSGRRVAVDATHLDGLSGGRLAVAKPAFRAVAICQGRRRQARQEQGCNRGRIANYLSHFTTLP